MPDEDKNDVGDKDLLNEKGEHPETISWAQYVRTKETIGGKLNTEREKVTSLEERLKDATSTEEFNKVKEELETTKTKLTETDEELKNTKDKSLTEKRSILTKRNIPEEKVKDMSDKELDAAIVVLEHSKPGADLGGGGGGGELKGSPMELAQRAYSK